MHKVKHTLLYKRDNNKFAFIILIFLSLFLIIFAIEMFYMQTKILKMYSHALIQASNDIIVMLSITNGFLITAIFSTLNDKKMDKYYSIPDKEVSHFSLLHRIGYYIKFNLWLGISLVILLIASKIIQELKVVNFEYLIYFVDIFIAPLLLFYLYLLYVNTENIFKIVLSNRNRE